MADQVMFSDYDGTIVADPSYLDFTCTNECDDCGEMRQGIMFHAAGATGRVCPVLFLCDECRENSHVQR